MRQAFGTAMSGRSKERPQLAALALPFEVHLPVLPARPSAQLSGLALLRARLPLNTLHLNELPEEVRRRLRLPQGALTYRDERLRGFDAAALLEVMEHLDEARLEALEQAVFGDARPGTVVLSTPNAKYPGLLGERRYSDHRFEWQRDQFSTWAQRVAAQYGYRGRLSSVGAPDPLLGYATQLAVFTLGPAHVH